MLSPQLMLEYCAMGAMDAILKDLDRGLEEEAIKHVTQQALEVRYSCGLYFTPSLPKWPQRLANAGVTKNTPRLREWGRYFNIPGEEWGRYYSRRSVVISNYSGTVYYRSTSYTQLYTPLFSLF